MVANSETVWNMKMKINICIMTNHASFRFLCFNLQKIEEKKFPSHAGNISYCNTCSFGLFFFFYFRCFFHLQRKVEMSQFIFIIRFIYYIFYAVTSNVSNKSKNSIYCTMYYIYLLTCWYMLYLWFLALLWQMANLFRQRIIIFVQIWVYRIRL